MRFSYKFSNLCGTVYNQGNLVFSPDGGTLLSPVGNRITAMDLEGSKSATFPFESRGNLMCLALSPDGGLLIAVDQDGHALLVNHRRAVVLNHFNFKGKVSGVTFSPDGKLFAAAVGRQLQIWQSPGLGREYAPFVLHRTLAGHFDDVLSMDWADDSQTLVSGSRDLTARLWSVDPAPGFPVSLAGHKESVVGVFFSAQGSVYTVARDGSLFVWDEEEGEERKVQVGRKRGRGGQDTRNNGAWRLGKKHYFNQGKALCAALHKASGLLVVGFSNGIFGLYEMPSFSNVHTLSISTQKISTVSINATGEWLAFGSKQLGQLLVWEWRSETYVLKQQGHAHGMSCLDYSPNGSLICTGGDDGKVKAWNATSGFCFITFTEHTAPVKAVVFTPKGNAVVSASLDGSVRAFDLTRYRNFRTLTTPKPQQFCSLALDHSGEIVCAGTQDSFEIFVWSMQTGRLLDVLAGHEGPVSSLAFSPTEAILASGSWDKTVKLWDIFETKTATQSLPHQADVLCVSWRHDGKEVCSSSLNGNINVWDVKEATLTATIECRRDVAGGRKNTEKSTFAAQAAASSFTAVCYSADGKCILAGGNTKWVCIYSVARRVCVKKFAISSNKSLDGVSEQLNSKNLTEAGPMALIEHDSDAELDGDSKDRADDSLPGSKRASKVAARQRPAIRTTGARFSPSGRAWAAATTEGLVVYSLDAVSDFDPLDLDIDLTPSLALEALEEGEYLKAMLMSLRLNEADVLRSVYERIPSKDIRLVCSSVPTVYLQRLVDFVATQVDSTPHIQLHLMWARWMLMSHGNWLSEKRSVVASSLKGLHKALSKQFSDIGGLANNNLHTVTFLSTTRGEEDEDNGPELGLDEAE